MIVNPLREVGVPEWMVRQAMEDGPEALERLRQHIRYLIGSTGRTYHPDVLPVDPRRAYRRVVEAAEQLTTVEDIEAWATLMIDPDADTGQLERLRAQAAARTKARQEALLRMLSVVSPFAVAGCSDECELVFGLPSISDVVEESYGRTFLLRIHRTVPGGLWLVEDSEGLVLGFDTIPVWDDAQCCWRVEHWEVPSDGPLDADPVRYVSSYSRLRASGNVQLVGAVPAREAAGLYELSHMVLPASTPMVGGPSTLGLSPARQVQLPGDQLVWYPADGAWWMDGMQPTLGQDDFGVVMRPTTGELALVGRLLAVRTL